MFSWARLAGVEPAARGFEVRFRRITSGHRRSPNLHIPWACRTEPIATHPVDYEDFATRLLPAEPEIHRGPDRSLSAVMQQSLLTVKQLAAKLGVCTATIYRLCDRGELPYVRVAQALRLVPMEVAAYLATRRRGT